MNTSLTSFFRRLRVAALMLLALAAIATWAEGQLQLGSMSYARAEAPFLRMPVSASPMFFRRVGGVAFNAVAQGVDDLQVTGLRYDPSAADGSRLVVELQRGSQKMSVRPLLFDWQLVPIARFAKDENGSAMTLFGQLKDKSLQRQLQEQQNRIINYHPALDNTLLGQRMFQADVLIIQPNAVHVFRDSRGLLLGAGEKNHDPQRNLQAFMAVSRWQEERATNGERYQSYVVGDIGQSISFDVRSGMLAFSGRPYWAAWRSRHSPAEMEAGMARLEAEHDAKVSRYNDMVRDHNARQATMPAAELQQLQATLRRLKREIEEAEKQVEGEFDRLTAVDQMPEFSRNLSDQIAAVNGINPLVYHAVTQVMHYRALFKHFQRRNAAAYSSFVESMKTVEPSPQVITPTVQRAQ